MHGPESAPATCGSGTTEGGLASRGDQAASPGGHPKQVTQVLPAGGFALNAVPKITRKHMRRARSGARTTREGQGEGRATD